MSGRPKLVAIDGAGQVDELHDQTPVPTDQALLVERLLKVERLLARRELEIRKLKMDLVEPEAEVVMNVLEFWVARCRGGSKRVKIPLTGQRAWLTLQRLKDNYTPEELKRAILVAEQMPFVHFGRRYCEAAPGRERKDDIIDLFRDEARVDKLLRLEFDTTGHKAYEHFVYDLTKSDPGVMAALAVLGAQAPHGEVLARAAAWAHKQQAAQA
jgi:hypothetical protein